MVSGGWGSEMLKEGEEFRVRNSFKQLKVCFRIQLPLPGSTFY